MSWHLLRMEAESEDRSVRAFAWVLVLAVGFWLIVAALLVWGLTR